VDDQSACAAGKQLDVVSR